MKVIPYNYVCKIEYQLRHKLSDKHTLIHPTINIQVRLELKTLISVQILLPNANANSDLLSIKNGARNKTYFLWFLAKAEWWMMKESLWLVKGKN